MHSFFQKHHRRNILMVAFAVLSPVLFAVPAQGGIIEDLRDKITGRSSEIERLEKEISEYQKQIEQTSKTAKTLQGSIKTLDVTQKKLEKDIDLTKNKLEGTEYKIEKTSIEIGNKKVRITQGSRAVAEMMRTIDELDQASLVEVIFSNESLADFWERADGVERLQEVLGGHIIDLKTAKDELEEKKLEQEVEKRELARYQDELDDRKKIVVVNKSTKNQLLAQTKNNEANYKKVLAEKLALKEAFEKELRNYESQLRAVIDTNLLPSKGSRGLSWPLASVALTQTFGDTDFARSGAYSGNGHNGVDFRASLGTKVFSAADGVVEGTGDTDIVCPGASYGKWVLVRHENGLSTLYAHLSLIKVTKGDTVATGGLLGYSGNTGYSTGPHLHFTVYATQAVKIESKKSKVCGGTYTMPIAALNAYLNPLDYLPAR